MFLTYLMLAVALCLSAIAAFYSIVGLAAIFAAAVIPIVVMGSILEIAKLTVTVWLHEYWHQCKRAMKMYLVPAVGILMVITSMGIFGFLSKAHLDQAVPTGDVAAQVSLLDEKIRTQRDNIDAARKALAQMDAAVDQTMARSSDEKGADKAAALRRSQARERGNLQSDIARAQAEIAKLNEQRAPIASELRKVEAEVGPIKYIAALIYGDNPDANLLEKAVRWVIIILVIVFDPLAIFMLLAATESYKWEKHGQSSAPQTLVEPPKQPVTDALDRTRAWGESLWQKIKRKPKNESVNGSDTPKTSDDHATVPDVRPSELVGQDVTVPNTDTGTGHEENLAVVVDSDDETSDSAVLKQAKSLWKQDNPDKTLKEQRRLLANHAIDKLPWEDYINDPRIVHDVGYGDDFPDNPFKGDLWITTDSLPTRLFKYNGEKWIEVDKNQTDQYVYNTAYVDHLIQSISQGHYDPELLTDSEREQIEARLRKEV